MGLAIPPLKIKIMLESYPLKFIMLVPGLAVAVCSQDGVCCSDGTSVSDAVSTSVGALRKSTAYYVYIYMILIICRYNLCSVLNTMLCVDIEADEGS